MKTLKNYLYNLSYQLLVLILPIILTPYISRVLKVDGIGLHSVAVAVGNYFILFGMLGINSYGSRQIAYVRDDIDELKKTFWEINILKLFTMGLSICLYIIMVTFFIPYDKQIIYYIETLTLLASLFDISWLFSGLEQFKVTAIRNIIVKITGVLLIVLLVKQKEDLWLYTLILSTASLIGQIIIWKDIPNDIKKIDFNIHKLCNHFKNTIKLWLPSIAIQVYSSLDKVMLGYIINDTQAGLYESSQKLVRMGATITTAMSTVLVPKMSNLYINNKNNEFKEVACKAFSFVSMLSFPLAFGLAAIRKSLVPWFYGSGYEATSNLLLISSWLIVSLGWSSILGLQVLVSSKNEIKYTFSVTIGAIVNIILNVLLIKKFQSAGALVASVLAEYIGMTIMMYFSRKLISINNCLRSAPKYLLFSLCMYFIVYNIGELFPYSIYSTFLQIFIGLLVYILLLIIFKDDHVKSLIRFIKK